jgi:integrase
MNKKGHRSFGYIRTLASGRFQASYVGPDGKRYFAQSSFRATRDANEWLSKRHVEIQREEWTSPTLQNKDRGKTADYESSTLDSVMETFLANRLTRGAKPLRENTKDLYRRLMKSALRDFRYIPLNSITEQMVNEWYLLRVSSSKVTTASKGYKLLKMVFKWAKKSGIVDFNPCDIEGAQSASSAKPVDSPEPEEVRQISKFMPDEWQFAVLLGSFAGLRYGELTELRRKDIIFYLENGEEHFKLNIRRAVAYFNKSFSVGLPKSKLGTRVIEVNKALVGELRIHLDNHVGSGKDSLLFSKSNSWIRHDYFIRAWNKAIKLSGLEGRDLVPHSMRHFGATQMVIAGATMAELKLWLGDSSTEAVSRYLHATGRNRGLANAMKFA